MKKILALVLSFVLIISAFPLAVFANRTISTNVIIESSAYKLRQKDEEQYIDVVYKINTGEYVTAFQAWLDCPEGWEIVDITNTLDLYETSTHFNGTNTGMVHWILSEDENYHDITNLVFQKLCIVTYKIPANEGPGTYTLTIRGENEGDDLIVEGSYYQFEVHSQSFEITILDSQDDQYSSFSASFAENNYTSSISEGYYSSPVVAELNCLNNGTMPIYDSNNLKVYISGVERYNFDTVDQSLNTSFDPGETVHFKDIRLTQFDLFEGTYKVLVSLLLDPTNGNWVNDMILLDSAFLTLSIDQEGTAVIIHQDDTVSEPYNYLGDAMYDAVNGDTIKLLRSFRQLCDFPEITDKEITIDFDNNYVVISRNDIDGNGISGNPFYINQGSDIIFRNGTLTSIDENYDVIKIMGGYVDLYEMNIEQGVLYLDSGDLYIDSGYVNNLDLGDFGLERTVWATDPQCIGTYPDYCSWEFFENNGLYYISENTVSQYAISIYRDNEVLGYDDLSEAFGYCENGDRIVLNRDIEIETSSIDKTDVVLDLNGYHIHATRFGIIVQNGGDVTIMNGEITGESEDTILGSDEVFTKGIGIETFPEDEVVSKLTLSNIQVNNILYYGGNVNIQENTTVDQLTIAFEFCYYDSYEPTEMNIKRASNNTTVGKVSNGFSWSETDNGYELNNDYQANIICNGHEIKCPTLQMAAYLANDVGAVRIDVLKDYTGEGFSIRTDCNIDFKGHTYTLTTPCQIEGASTIRNGYINAAPDFDGDYLVYIGIDQSGIIRRPEGLTFLNLYIDHPNSMYIYENYSCVLSETTLTGDLYLEQSSLYLESCNIGSLTFERQEGGYGILYPFIFKESAEIGSIPDEYEWVPYTFDYGQIVEGEKLEYIGYWSVGNNTYQTLNEAIDAAISSGEEIILLKDSYSHGSYPYSSLEDNLGDTINLVLDLNEHVLESTINIGAGYDVTFRNGTLTSPDSGFLYLDARVFQENTNTIDPEIKSTVTFDNVMLVKRLIGYDDIHGFITCSNNCEIKLVNGSSIDYDPIYEEDQNKDVILLELSGSYPGSTTKVTINDGYINGPVSIPYEGVLNIESGYIGALKSPSSMKDKYIYSNDDGSIGELPYGFYWNYDVDNGRYELTKDFEARIIRDSETKDYKLFGEAINDMNAGDTVELLYDTSGVALFISPQGSGIDDITIDFCGHQYNVVEPIPAYLVNNSEARKYDGNIYFAVKSNIISNQIILREGAITTCLEQPYGIITTYSDVVFEDLNTDGFVSVNNKLELDDFNIDVNDPDAYELKYVVEKTGDMTVYCSKVNGAVRVSGKLDIDQSNINAIQCVATSSDDPISVSKTSDSIVRNIIGGFDWNGNELVKIPEAEIVLPNGQSYEKDYLQEALDEVSDLYTVRLLTNVCRDSIDIAVKKNYSIDFGGNILFLKSELADTYSYYVGHGTPYMMSVLNQSINNPCTISLRNGKISDLEYNGKSNVLALGSYLGLVVDDLIIDASLMPVQSDLTLLGNSAVYNLFTPKNAEVSIDMNIDENDPQMYSIFDLHLDGTDCNVLINNGYIENITKGDNVTIGDYGVIVRSVRNPELVANYNIPENYRWLDNRVNYYLVPENSDHNDIYLYDEWFSVTDIEDLEEGKYYDPVIVTVGNSTTTSDTVNLNSGYYEFVGEDKNNPSSITWYSENDHSEQRSLTKADDPGEDEPVDEKYILSNRSNLKLENIVLGDNDTDLCVYTSGDSFEITNSDIYGRVTVDQGSVELLSGYIHEISIVDHGDETEFTVKKSISDSEVTVIPNGYEWQEFDDDTEILVYIGEEPVDPESPSFVSRNLTLSGQIGMNIYMDLSVLSEDEQNSCYMEFTIGNDPAVYTDSFDRSFTATRSLCYGFTVNVNTLQMADTIHAVLHYQKDGEDLTVSKDYTVESYFTSFDQVESQYTQETVDLVHAVADYGYYAQHFLAEANDLILGEDYVEMTKHYAESYDFDSLRATLADYALLKDIEGSGVTSVSYRLSLKSETRLDVFFTLDPSVTEFEASTVFRENEYTAVQQSENVYMISINNLSGHLLGTPIHITGTANDEFSVDLYALSYANAIMKGNYNDTYKNAMSALYYYYSTNIAYRDSINQ